MTENQELKMQLLKEFASGGKPESVDFCKKAYGFLTDDEAMLKSAESADETADGIYLVLQNGKHVLFTGNNNACDVGKCIGIGVKWGERSIVVALHDFAKSEEITLTKQKDTANYAGYIDNYLDAVADWNGKANTEHLKEIGLNERINLPDNWYIPSLGEMYLIFLNLREINRALKYVCATQLVEDVYWTSTECGAPGAWYLYLFTGGAGTYAKASFTFRVRAVSAFIS